MAVHLSPGRSTIARASLAVGTLLALVSTAGASAAGPNDIRIEPGRVSSVDAAERVTLAVVSRASVDTSGIAAAVTFDPGVLRLIAIAKATDPLELSTWADQGATFTGYPASSSEVQRYLSTANSSGRTPRVSARFEDGFSAVLAGTDAAFLELTFEATSAACGSSTVGLPIGTGDGGFINGSLGAQNGLPLPNASVTSSPGTTAFTKPCGVTTAKPSPTVKPTATRAATDTSAPSESPEPAATTTAAIASSGSAAGSPTPPPTATPPVAAGGRSDRSSSHLVVLAAGVVAALLAVRRRQPGVSALPLPPGLTVQGPTRTANATKTTR